VSVPEKRLATSVKEVISIGQERLRGVDALRGAAALGVVLYHEVGSKPHASTGTIWNWLASPLWAVSSFGYAGVFLFFVISGFCIHLQWARRRTVEEKPRTDFVAFWKRRFRRLYPPYLIALAIYLVVSGFTTKLQATAFYVWDVFLHLVMLHNLDGRTAYSINGVFWTLAIEEQLYLSYFLLLYFRNRLGWRRTLLLCAAARVIWLVLSVGARNAFGLNIPVTEAAASHWFTWALGALAVEAAFGLVILPGWCSKISIGILGLLSAVGLTYCLPLIESHQLLHDSTWLLLHPLWGFAFFVILNHFVVAERQWRQALRVPALVQSLASIGLFSYSLYLTHQLVLMESYRFTRLGLSETFVALVIMTPATLFFAWIFFAFCERPYLGSPSFAIGFGSDTATETGPSYFKISRTPASLLAANPVESGQSGQIFR
jgi:peptidoglycan/LPS O-acetylase OafA/YrhL